MTMPMPSESTLLSAEEFALVRVPHKRTGLQRGRLLISEPLSTKHGRIQASLAYFITDHVRRNGLGAVFGQDTGFQIESSPDTVRGPDVAFVRRERAAEIPRRDYAALAPDSSRKSSRPRTDPASTSRRSRSGSTRARGSCGSSIRNAPRPTSIVRMAA